MAVPLPLRTPVTEVVIVIAGVVAGSATLPANPLAVTTETVVTVPVPGGAGVTHFSPVVSTESAVRTCPFDPTPRRVPAVTVRV
jgi:hypothetical protein